MFISGLALGNKGLQILSNVINNINNLLFIILFFCWSFNVAAVVNGELRVESLHYLPEQQDLATATQWWRARLTGKANKYSINYNAELATLSENQQSLLYANVAELYWRSNYAVASSEVIVGRYRLAWSKLDDHWFLGIWQPRFRWDYLRPELQGLVGLFINSKVTDKWSFNLFASPVFIPEIDPPIEEHGGSLVSRYNRWFEQPPEEVYFNKPEQTTKIRYSLEYPETGRVVFNPAIGVMAGYKENSGDGLWLQVSYGVKPINQMPILYRERINVLEKQRKNEADVSLTTEVRYHHVGAFDVGHTGHAFSWWASLLGDSPIKQDSPSSWTIYEPRSLLTTGIGIDYKTKIFSRGPILLSFSFLKVDGGKNEKIGSGLVDDVNNGMRVDFARAINLRIAGPLWKTAGTAILFTTNWIYDFLQEGSILTTELRVKSEQKWSIFLGADVLGVESATKINGLIRKFSANDRFFGGVSYAF